MRNSLRYPHLLRADVLRGLPDDVKLQFLDDCVMRNFDQTTSILVQGEAVNGMYLVAHGSVEITGINSEGQTVLIHLSRQDEVFGDVEAIGEKTAAANCTAMPNTVVLFYSKHLLIESMRCVTFMRNVFALTHDRLVRDNRLKFVDQFYPVDQRLCDYLYRLSVERPEISKTQADLAGLLGCARQTLNRELGRLRDQNIIQMEKGKIRVADREALYQQATRGDAIYLVKKSIA